MPNQAQIEPRVSVRPYGLLVYDLFTGYVDRAAMAAKIKARKEQVKEDLKRKLAELLEAAEQLTETNGKHSSLDSAKLNEDSSNDSGKYTGVLTKFSKKKLTRSIQLITAIAQEKEAINFKTTKTFKFKLNFITLTLPSAQKEIPDKTIKNCLNLWIKRQVRKNQLRSYVWRAERQANGNIHFHIITDCYIHYEKIRSDWNSCLAKTGLVQSYTAKHEHLTLKEYLKMYPENEKVTRAMRVESYNKGRATLWTQPNSTDVHAIIKVKNLTAYFVKYMSKSHKEGEKPIQGKIWDCSENLKTKDSCTTIRDSSLTETIQDIFGNGEYKTLNDDKFSIAFLNEEQKKKALPEKLYFEWLDYLKRIREFKSKKIET